MQTLDSPQNSDSGNPSAIAAKASVSNAMDEHFAGTGQIIESNDTYRSSDAIKVLRILADRSNYFVKYALNPAVNDLLDTEAEIIQLAKPWFNNTSINTADGEMKYGITDLVRNWRGGRHQPSILLMRPAGNYNLETILNNYRLKSSEILSIFSAVASIYDTFLANGIIPLDPKPANIMLFLNSKSALESVNAVDFANCYINKELRDRYGLSSHIWTSPSHAPDLDYTSGVRGWINTFVPSVTEGFMQSKATSYMVRTVASQLFEALTGKHPYPTIEEANKISLERRSVDKNAQWLVINESEKTVRLPGSKNSRDPFALIDLEQVQTLVDGIIIGDSAKLLLNKFMRTYLVRDCAEIIKGNNIFKNMVRDFEIIAGNDGVEM